MAYKSILTVVTDVGAVPGLLGAAAALAEREDAHLDVLCLGIDRTQAGYYYAGASALVFQETIEKAQSDADDLVAAVQAGLDGSPVRWAAEPAIAQIGSIVNVVGMRARFCDLVLLPRPYGDDRGIEAEAIAEAALFDGQAPVLIWPGEGTDLGKIGRRIVLAWNQSNEALAAARRALPLLKKAELVDITVIDPPRHGPERSDPGGALSQFLSRHGVRAEVSVLARTMPRISDILLRQVQDINADLLVMGAYGHSRFREAILGGATRNMLELADVPVFLAH